VAYVPEGSKWFLAEIVEEITVEGDPRNVVHTNLVLIRADSPEEAYEKSMRLGAERELTYDNTAGKRVTILFRGLHDLNVIHDKLEHGAELISSEEVGMNESALGQWVAAKEDLGVFRPIEWSQGPDYASGEVMEDVYDRFPHLRPDDRSKPN
jgi:Domain of unknown function (DUF4288)